MEFSPCDPTAKNTDLCHVKRTTGQCFEDVHHEFFPRRLYRTKTEQEFRELDDNKVRVCRDVHNELHAISPDVDKPDLNIMRQAIYLEKIKRIPEAS